MKRLIQGLALVAALVASFSADAAITFVGSVGTFAGVSADGYTTANQDTTGANFIIVCLGQGDASSAVVTDSKGNTWTPLTKQSAFGSKSEQLWYAYNATVGTGHTFTVDGTDNFPSMSIAWFAGVQTSPDPIDGNAGANAVFQNTLATGSVTPSVDGEVMVTGFGGMSPSASVPTIDSSFTTTGSITNTDFGHSQAILGYQIQTTATARNPTWTNTAGSDTLGTTLATFKAGGGAAAATPPRNRKTMGVGR